MSDTVTLTSPGCPADEDLWALGDDPIQATDDRRDHVAECPRCAARRARLADELRRFNRGLARVEARGAHRQPLPDRFESVRRLGGGSVRCGWPTTSGSSGGCVLWGRVGELGNAARGYPKYNRAFLDTVKAYQSLARQFGLLPLERERAGVELVPEEPDEFGLALEPVMELGRAVPGPVPRPG